MMLNMEATTRFTSDWFSPSIPLWERTLAPLAGKPGLRFLEIGCWEGRSASWLLENILTAPDASLICIDTFMGESRRPMAPEHGAMVEERFDHNIGLTGAAHKVRKLRGESRVMLRTLPFSHVDFAYIDGSHACDDVLRDAVLTWDVLKDGGLAVFDDYGWGKYPDDSLMHPKRGIDAFLEAFAEDCTILHKDYQVIVRKRGIPVVTFGSSGNF